MPDLLKESDSSLQAIQVLLAYPRVLTGQLIVKALSHNSQFHVAAHVSSGDALIAFTRHAQIHVALIAVSLAAPEDGLNALRRLRVEYSQIRPVMLMETPYRRIVVESFRLGAKGVFSMSTGGYELLCKCIQAVNEGQIWATSQELHWVVDSLLDTPQASAAVVKSDRISEFRKLSKRKFEVVNLLANEFSNRAISHS
jgi:DNA-binding NarL/FixJ family response regulator